MSSSNKGVVKALAILGDVSKKHVETANGSLGGQWLRGFSIAEETIKSNYPNVTGMEIAGAKAHQSSQVKSHSNVISVKFFDHEKRVLAGHIHLNGTIDVGRVRSRAGSDSAWTPVRAEVDMAQWTIYDPERKKHRKVTSEGDWWFVEIGGQKVYF